MAITEDNNRHFCVDFPNPIYATEVGRVDMEMMLVYERENPSMFHANAQKQMTDMKTIIEPML